MGGTLLFADICGAASTGTAAGAAAGGLGAAAGNPENKSGMLLSTTTLVLAAFGDERCVRNKGATTFKGSFNKTSPCGDSEEVTAGRIQDRNAFQVKTSRPCLNPSSTGRRGSATFAPERFKRMISWRTGSGQSSDTTDKAMIRKSEAVSESGVRRAAVGMAGSFSRSTG